MVAKLKNVKMKLKAWAINYGDPQKLAQGKIDSLRIAAEELEANHTNQHKLNMVIKRKEDLPNTMWI